VYFSVIFCRNLRNLNTSEIFVASLLVQATTTMMRQLGQYVNCLIKDKYSVPLGSETRIYEFPVRKYRSIEVGNVVFLTGKLGSSASTPTSDSEIRVSKPDGTQHKSITLDFHVDGEVTNFSATSRCNGIWETTRHNRHNGLLPVTTCYGLVTGKLV